MKEKWGGKEKWLQRNTECLEKSLLKDRWQESASTHFEETDKITLKVSDDNNYIILEEYHDELDMFRPKQRPPEIVKYQIEPNKLISLIKEHGQENSEG